MDEFAKDPRIEKAYKLWYEMRDEICRIYKEQLPERKPLSQQKEFKPVRNMVIRETLKLIEQEFTCDDVPVADKSQVDDEPVSEEESASIASILPTPSHQAKKSDITDTDVSTAVLRILHHIGNIFRQKATEDDVYAGLQIDKKRRREMLDKRIALGHKIDDHEDRIPRMR